MRKRLALVLLAPECSSWPSVATDPALPVWFDTPPVFVPWAAAQALMEAWLHMLMALLPWVPAPRIKI